MSIFFFSLSFQGTGQKGEIVGEPTKNGAARPPQGCLQYILDCNGVAVGPKPVQANWATREKGRKSQSLDNNDVPLDGHKRRRECVDADS